MEDWFIFLCLVKNPNGKLLGNEEGKYEWVKEKDLLTYMKNPFESLEQFKKDIEELNNFNGVMNFVEIDNYSNKF